MIMLWLKRILKYSLILFLIILLAIVGWLGYYYVKEIRPYKPVIENILANADPENRHPPKNVVAMIDADFYIPPEIRDRPNIKGRADKNDIITKHIEWRRNMHKRTMYRRINEIFLANTIVENLTENDKNALFSELSYVGFGKEGLNYFSTKYFAKPLSNLSLQEAAELIAISNTPSWFRNKPDKIQERKNYLLKKYNLMIKENK